MEETQTLEYISNFGVLVTIVLFLSGTPVAYEIHQRKSVGSVPFFPFLATFVNCFLWVVYGCLINETAVIVPNVVGMCLGVTYVVVYISYSTNVQGYQSNGIQAGCIILFVLYIGLLDPFFDEETHVKLVGWVACCGSVAMFGSPLVTVKEVMRTRSTKEMNFTMCLMNLVVSATWTCFGWMKNDNFILLPNFLGFVLSTLQVGLFGIYPSSSMELPK
eukprot:Lithocolla_globosa_v1_NODE_8070_length_865_cov_10.529630.p1 type:complete len:218 gc:universal NODE_8070_length_865_cov_10.529630:826-173(-)